MFIDYVTLMLANMAAGLGTLAWFLWEMGQPGYMNGDVMLHGGPGWAAAFAVVGLIALITGLRMIFTWPLPGPYNCAFGELSVLLSGIFLGLALTLGMGQTPGPLAVYALVAGAVAVLVGLRVMTRRMTKTPFLAGVGFILSGLGGGLFALIAFSSYRATAVTPIGFAGWTSMEGSILCISAAAVIGAAAVIWALTGLRAYWSHLGNLDDWQPGGAGRNGK